MVEKIDTHVLRISNQDRSVPPNERSTGNFSVSFPNERFSMTNKILHLERVTYFNTIPTIYDSSYGDLQNDIVRLSDDGGKTWKEKHLTTGKYTVGELVDELNRVTAELSGFEERAWSYSPTAMRLKLKLPAEGRYDLQPTNGAYAVIGSAVVPDSSGGEQPLSVLGGTKLIDVNGRVKTTALPRATEQTMPYVADMSAGINHIYVYLDPPITEGIRDGKQSSSLGTLVGIVPVEGHRGQQVTYSYVDSPHFPVSYHGLLESLRVRLCDSSGVPVNFGRLEASVQIKFSTPVLTDTI